MLDSGFAEKVAGPELSLMKHQTEALDFIYGKDGAAIYFEMGLGKTLIILEQLRRIGAEAFPALIICPLSAVSVWTRESEKFGYPFKFAELTGTYDRRERSLFEPADVYTVNYEGLRVINNLLPKRGFKTMILDEVHRCKDPGSQQTRIALELSRTVQRRYILTGTPVAKSPEDIWTQFQIIAPGVLGNYYAFRARYVEYKSQMIRVKGSLREIRKPVRFKNSKELAERIKPFSLRRTKAECLDLPPKIYKVIPCPMSPEQTKHYHALRVSLKTMLEEKQLCVPSITSQIQKMQQVCQGFIYGENKKAITFPSGKLDMLKDILKDIVKDKTIIFTWYQADEIRLSDELSKEYRVLSYNGNPTERAALEKEFQESTEPCIFLAQIERAKESITLTAASHVIYYGNTYNYVSRVQSEDRAHRKGQTKSVIYYDLVCPHTVEENILHALKTKGTLANAVTQDSVRLARMILEEGEDYVERDAV